MRAKDFLKDDKDTWAGGGTEFEPDWNQEIGMDAGQGYQRASGNLPGGVNLSVAADAPGQMSTFDAQRGVNIAKGPASLYLGDKGSVSGSYNIPVGQDSSVSLNASGQRDRGVQSYGLNYQKGGFSAGVSKGTQPGATPQVNVGYSAQFEEDADVEEGKIISDRELVDVYLKGKHYDQIIQKKVAEGIPNRMVHAFIDKVAAKFGLNPSAFIYGPSRDEISEIREDNADYDEDKYLKSDPGTPLSFPKGTTLVNVSDVYDWYKLGMAVSDLDDADPRTFNRGVPHTVFAFGSEEEEHRMIPLLKRLGFSLHDIDSPEDYEKAIRASDVMEHLEEMVNQGRK